MKNQNWKEDLLRDALWFLTYSFRDKVENLRRMRLRGYEDAAFHEKLNLTSAAHDLRLLLSNTHNPKARAYLLKYLRDEITNRLKPIKEAA